MPSILNWLGAGLLVTGCVAAQDPTPSGEVAVSEPNTLGVVALQIDRSGQQIEIRGLDAAGDEVALVRRRIGELDALTPNAMGSRLGSELTTTVAGESFTHVTRETELLSLPAQPATTDAFVMLPEVSSALHDARISFQTRPRAVAGEAPFYAAGCDYTQSYLNVTPLGRQCCQYNIGYGGWSANDVMFVDPNGALVTKLHVQYEGSPPYGICRASDGVSACSGASCYFGPNGYARPVVTTGGGQVPIISVANIPDPAATQYDDFYDQCVATWYSPGSAPAHNFNDVTGTFPNGYGCCADGSGPCANPAACAACGCGNAGQGDWD